MNNKDLGLLLLRLALAAVFLAHGIQKFTHMEGTIAFFGNLGMPEFLAWLVALAESAAGAAMLLGLWTRWAGYVIAIIMLVAIVKVKWAMGFLGGYELDLTLLLMALAVSVIGPGKYALGKSGGQAV